MRMIKILMAFLAIAFLLPMAAAAVWWSTLERPGSWRDADWSASGVLPDATADPEAAIYILAARTGGFKGAFSVHSWIVVKEAGASRYLRLEKVGWGTPVRRNAYAPDATWYSNTPFILREVHGEAAARLIPKIEAAVQAYPFATSGDYRIWPGPNSNTFVASVLRAVPELGLVLPANAVGKDYLGVGEWFVLASDGRDIHLSLFGYAGISAGWHSGFEIHFLGQTVGVGVARPALKIPAFGTFRF